jgi:UPF0176 protein
MVMHKVILYYCFTPISDTAAVKLWQRALCESLGLKGRIIISKHGINGTLGGEIEALRTYVKQTKKYDGFRKVDFKWSAGVGTEFPKLSVKVRKELVAFGNPDEIQVTENGVVGTGTHLRPEQVHELVAERGDEVVFFDVRNTLESKIGKFRNAIVPDVESSRDFVAEIESGKYDHLKDKPIVAYCTGGIRCEVISAVMKTRGFEEVYQVKGGILRYGNKFGDDGLWDGSLYVFDDRMAIDFSSKAKTIGVCEACSVPTKIYVNCSNIACHKLVLLCKPCAAKDRSSGCEHDLSKKRDSSLIG